MAGNTLLTPSIIAREALMQLDNNLVVAGLVYRDYEDEFVKVGDTISIRRPVKYQVTDGPTLSLQDTLEGKVQITINKQKHVDMFFSSKDLTLTIEQFSERYIKPAMIVLANQVDLDVYSLYQYIWNWVGTPGNRLNTIPGFLAGPQRLDEMAVPNDARNGILSPNDYYGMVGNFTTLLQPDIVKGALQRARLGMIGNVDTYQAQNIPTLTTGTRVTTGASLVDGANQNVTYANSMNTNTSTVLLKAMGNAKTVKAGEVVTFAGVYAINPVSKNAQTYLQQFVVQADVTSSAGGAGTLTIGPALIPLDTTDTDSIPYATCSTTPADGAAVTYLGALSTAYTNNLVFHKNALALCTVPLDLPPAAAYKARDMYKNLSVRVVGLYDGTNDRSIWRFDILYGVKAIYPDLAARLSGA